MQNIETFEEESKHQPRSQFNALHIPSAVERKIDSQGNYVITGNFKKGFEWITEDGVICCEHIHGTNLSLDIVGNEIINVVSRANHILNIFSDDPLWFQAIDVARSKGMIPSTANTAIAEIAGTIPIVKANEYFAYEDDYVPWIPRSHQMKRMKYSQWGKKPKTIENISTWLQEDLASHMPYSIARYIGAGHMTCPTDRNEHLFRPYGLLFVHPSGRMGRINCRDFPWYYEEGLGKTTTRKNKNKITKEKWDSLTDGEKEIIRYEARAQKRGCRVTP